MPAATTPLGKPGAAAKPSGFTMPTGLNRQAPSKAEEEEETEKGPQPVHIAISAVALIIVLLFCWTVFQGDQVPNRTSEYMFGQPALADAAAGASFSADDQSSDDEEEGDEEDSEDEEE